MSVIKMHADEVATDAALVRRLLRAQHPRWADLPIALVPSAGTDNALYRLGDEMVVRLPRIGWAVGQVELEWEWLPRLARLLPVAVPAPLAVGVPAEGYPWTWAVYRWLEGEDGAAGRIADTSQAARDLAQFVTAMQRIDLPGDPPRSPRGGPLAMRDAETRAAIAASQGMIDAGAATAAWETALGVDEWSGRPVWIHGDLLPGNLLFERGRLSAVIDFSCLGVGDPACDLLPAWAFLTAGTREIFRNALGVDDATWARGRGWALSFGLIALPYYHVTNPVLAGVARYTISEVLAEHQHS